MKSASSIPGWLARPRWLVVLLLGIDTLFLLTALALTNITATGPAERALGHSVAILTDVDTYLDEHYDSILLQAQEATEPEVTLPGFPLNVAIAPPEAKALDRNQFRALLLDRSAALLRDDGTDAFLVQSGTAPDPASPGGLLRLSLELLRPTPHNIFAGLTIACAVIAAILSAAIVFTSPTNASLSIGSSILVAAALFLIVAVAARFVLRVAANGSDDEMTREFLKLAQELDWAPIRNGIIVCVSAALCIVPILGRRTRTNASL